jgi:hypothetical protein
MPVDFVGPLVGLTFFAICAVAAGILVQLRRESSARRGQE